MSIKYWKGGNAGVEGSFTETLVSDTLAASAVVDNGDGTVDIAVIGHAFDEDDYVVIEGTTYYDGNHRVVAESANAVTITSTYTAETPAGTETIKSSNWQDKLGVPVALPTDNDFLIIDDSAGVATDVSTKHTEGKHWNLCENIAKGDSGGIDLDGILIDSTFTGMVGQDSEGTVSPLHCHITAGNSIVNRSNYPVHIECSEVDATTDSAIPLVIFDSASGYMRLSSDVNSDTWVSKFTNVKCLQAGTLEFADTSALEAIHLLNSTTQLIMGVNCMNEKTDVACDLYLGRESTYSARAIRNVLELKADGVINFGDHSFTLTRSY